MRSDRLRPTDRHILEQLRDHPPDYMALVANRVGMPTGYVERRWQVLLEAGFVEPVTGEPIYRLTDAGERYLETEESAVAPAIE